MEFIVVKKASNIRRMKIVEQQCQRQRDQRSNFVSHVFLLEIHLLFKTTVQQFYVNTNFTVTSETKSENSIEQKKLKIMNFFVKLKL